MMVTGGNTNDSGNEFPVKGHLNYLTVLRTSEQTRQVGFQYAY